MELQSKMNPELLASFTRKIEEGILVRPDRRSRSKPIMLTLICKGHRVDPLSVITQNRIMTWIRMMRADSTLCTRLSRKLITAARTNPAPGPVSLLSKTFRELKWKWEGGSTVSMPVAHMDNTTSSAWISVDCLTEDKGKLQHAVREAARLFRWRGPGGSKTRKNLKGISKGVDKVATLAVLRASAMRTSGCLTPYEAGILRHILADATMTGERMARWNMINSPTCPYCTDGVDEDHEHRWFTCSGFDFIRESFPEVMQMDRAGWPPCLSRCAILPKCSEQMCPPNLLADMQKMLVEIEVERFKMDKSRRQLVSNNEQREYPWSWSPPNAAQFPNSLHDYWPGLTDGWSWSHVFFVAMKNWLKQLRWGPVEAGHQVTLLEMVIDFEVTTGVDVPVLPKTNESFGAELLRKTRTMNCALTTLKKLQKGPVMPATQIKHSGWLKALTAAARGIELLGLDRRPVFGIETLCVMEELRDAIEDSTAPDDVESSICSGTCSNKDVTSEDADSVTEHKSPEATETPAEQWDSQSDDELQIDTRVYGQWMASFTGGKYPPAEERGKRAAVHYDEVDGRNSNFRHRRPRDAPAKP